MPRYTYSTVEWQGKTIFCANNPGCSGTWFTHKGKTLIRKSAEPFSLATLDAGKAITVNQPHLGFNSPSALDSLQDFISEMESI